MVEGHEATTPHGDHAKLPVTVSGNRESLQRPGKLNSANQANGETSDVSPEPCGVYTLERPHRYSYYIPGKVEGKPINFLLDTGCNTNLLSKKAFNLLPTRIKKLLEENERFGFLANGSRLPFHGVVRLAGRVRDVPIEESFVVSEINEDAILDMPLHTTHGC